MKIDEMSDIAQIIARDAPYLHFIKKIRSELAHTKIDDKTSSLSALYADNKFAHIGFCIYSRYSAKLKMWEKTFREEGWVDPSFKISKKSFELMYLYVMPEYRKQKKAESLLDMLIKSARDEGIEEIYAYVSALDQYAYNFYLKRGATVICSFSDEEDGNFTSFLKWTL